MTVHVVLNDFGRFGTAYVETDPAEADLESVVRNMIAGQYDHPLRVDAYDVLAGTARDASADIARAVARACETRLSAGVRAFCERNGVSLEPSG